MNSDDKAFCTFLIVLGGFVYTAFVTKPCENEQKAAKELCKNAIVGSAMTAGVIVSTKLIVDTVDCLFRLV